MYNTSKTEYIPNHPHGFALFCHASHNAIFSVFASFIRRNIPIGASLVIGRISSSCPGEVNLDVMTKTGRNRIATKSNKKQIKNLMVGIYAVMSLTVFCRMKWRVGRRLLLVTSIPFYWHGLTLICNFYNFMQAPCMCQHYLSMRPGVILEAEFENYVDWLNANHEKSQFIITDSH